jgi:hypothetical protein
MTCRLEPAAPRPPRAPLPLPDPLAWIAEAFTALQRAGLERPHRVRVGRQGREVELDGRRLVNFGSNDYLGYCGDVRLAKAAAKAACAEGFGAGASPLSPACSTCPRPSPFPAGFPPTPPRSRPW